MTPSKATDKKLFDPTNDGAQTDFSNRMAYLDYLKLDDILGGRNLLNLKPMMRCCLSFSIKPLNYG